MGKGGGKGGKSGGKIALSVIGGLVGGFGAAGAFFGTKSVLASVMYGLSLGSTIGSALFSSVDDPINTQNFDNKMNTADSSAMIPLIYGTRKAGGLQTYHKSNTSDKELRKHVLMAEGEIHNIYGLTANGYLTPYTTKGMSIVTTTTESSTAKKTKYRKLSSSRGHSYTTSTAIDKISSPQVFAITNIKDKNATFEIVNSQMRLNANNHYYEINLQNIKELEEDGSNDYRCSWGALFQYFIGDNYQNTLAEDGWVILDPVVCENYPSDVNNVSSQNAYNKIISVTQGKLPTEKSVIAAYRGSNSDKPPTTYKVTGGYPKIAYTDSILKYCEEIGAGNPTITGIINGKKCYDWRNKKTEYTENPVVCLYDYLLSDVYGLGGSLSEDMLDMDSFTDIANYCDEPVTYTNPNGIIVTEPRYSLNLMLSQSQEHIENIKAILKTFAGFIIFSNNKLKLCCERIQNPVYAFDDDNIIEKSVSYKSSSIDQSPNRINVSYIEPILDYTSVKVICEDTVNQQKAPYGRGRVIEVDVNLDGVTDQSQALRLGKIYRDIIRLCPITITFKTGAMAGILEAGDVITVSKSYFDDNGNKQTLFKNVQARIQEIKEERGTYEITARQYNSSIYDDSFGATLRNTPTNVTKNIIKLNPDTVLPVLNARTSAIYSGQLDGINYYDMRISWDKPKDVEYSGAKVYYKVKTVSASDLKVSSGVSATELGWTTSWRELGTAQTNLTLSQCKGGDIVRFKIVPLDSYKREHQESAVTIDGLVQVKTTTPSQPQNLRLILTDVAKVSWSAVNNADVKYYEIRTNTKYGSVDGLLGRTTGLSMNIDLLNRSGDIYCYAVNTVGKYSVPAKLTYNYPKPVTPDIPTVSEMFGGFTVTSQLKPSNAFGYVFYIDDKAYRSINPSYNYMTDIAGNYVVKVAFYDYFGESEQSFFNMANVKMKIKKEWIDSESISLQNIDKALQAKIETGVDASNAVTSVVNALNNSATNNEYSAIAQLSDALELRVKKDDVINQINMSPKTTTINGEFLHVTGSTKFDKNVLAKNLEANSVTADKLKVDYISAISENVGTLHGGTLIGTNIRNSNGSFTVDPNGNIRGANITASRIDAESIYQAGFRIRNIVIEQQTKDHGEYITIPTGFSSNNIIAWVQYIVDEMVDIRTFKGMHGYRKWEDADKVMRNEISKGNIRHWSFDKDLVYWKPRDTRLYGSNNDKYDAVYAGLSGTRVFCWQTGEHVKYPLLTARVIVVGIK